MGDANLNALWARALVEELRRGGVRHAVVCPGSRSAPLALACAEQLRTWSVVDERSAGFFALGLGKESGVPALLVATSGTAGAHFYPAIIEAFHGAVPMVVATADRPPELRGFGAPQTISQHRLYGDFCRAFYDLGVPETSDAVLRHLRAVAARAVGQACSRPRGPVHLNVPFREPLAPVVDPAFDSAGVSELARDGRRDTPLLAIAEPERRPSPETIHSLRARMEKEPDGAIICGPRDAADGLQEAAIALGRAYDYPVLAEAASQVRFGRSGEVVCLYDALLRHAPFAKAARPRLIVRMGGGLTSKVLQGWIDASGASQVLLGEEGAIFDPAHAAEQVLIGNSAATCRALAEGRAPRSSSSGFAERFFEAEQRARAALERAFPADAALSEPRTAREVAACLPPDALLFVSSSMPVRDLDGFADRGAAIRVLSNRGVNGIDGLISSALGASVSSGRPTVLLTGDLALLHDLGGLLTAHRHRLRLVTVVLNNDGGGIFSFLPIARATEHFEPLFATPHGLPLERAAALFGATHRAVERAPELREAIASGLEGGLHLVEVRVDRRENETEHQRLWREIAAALN